MGVLTAILVQSWTRDCRQIDEILQLIFRDYLVQMSKFSFCVLDWVLAIKSKHFSDFLEINYFLKS